MVLVLWVIGLASFITVLLASRDLRLVGRWGAVAGAALALWIVGPHWVTTHHLRPEHPLQWLIVAAFLAAVGAILGAVLSALIVFPAAAVLVARGREFEERVLGPALLALASVPPGYLLLSALLEWIPFGQVSGLRLRAPEVTVAAVAYAVLCGVTAVGHARLVQRPGPRAHKVLMVASVTSLVVGAMALPARRGGDAWQAAGPVPPLAREAPADSTRRRPLVVIGLDAGNWTTLRPLIESGRLPNLGRMVGNGVSGSVQALWPPFWSAPAWAAIVTGHDGEKTGVHEDLTARAPGLPPFELPLRVDILLNPFSIVERLIIAAGAVTAELMPRDQLRVPPVWERLAPAGIRTAAIRFPFTHPAAGQADVVVSYMVATDLWEAAGVKRGTAADLGSPERWAGAVAARFSEPADESTLRRIFPRGAWPQPADAVVDPVAVLRRMLDIEERVLDVAERVVAQEPDLDVIMVFIGSLDEVSHAFWQYRFPMDFPQRPPSAADVEALGDVIDRYLEYLDERIGRLLASVRVQPNVLVVSDHGLQSSPDEPMWRGWHSPDAIFIAAGPDIERRESTVSISYYDIVPTMLELAGVAKPPDLKGRSVLGDAR